MIKIAMNFKKLFRKLHKYDTNFLKLSMDSKSGFEMDVYEKKHDYELLKLGHRYSALTVCTRGYMFSFLPTTQMRL